MRIIYTIILLVLLAITFSKAQWKTTVEESNIISSAPGTQNYPSLALDRKGEFFVAWTDARNSSTGNDIYIQRFDSLGNTYFAENGIPVCNADGNQQYPWAVGTTDSCVIIFGMMTDLITLIQQTYMHRNQIVKETHYGN